VLLEVFLAGNMHTMHVLRQVSRAWWRVARFALNRLGPAAGTYVFGGLSRTPEVGLDTRWQPMSATAHLRPGCNTWVDASPMPTDRYHFGVAVVDRRVVVLGGRNASGRLRVVERFDPVTRQWTTLPSVPVVRSASAVVVQAGTVWMFGGFDGTSELATADRLGPDGWQADCCAPMPQPVCEVGAVAVGLHIYVIGGTQGRYTAAETILATMQRYTPSSNTWTTCAPMSTPRMTPAVVTIGGRIFAIGGANGSWSLNTVEVYDPATDSWAEMAPMSTPRSNCTACVTTDADGRPTVIVAGGFCKVQLDSVEAYDPEANVWTDMPPMPDARDACKIIAFE
jgi:hypothetical protein